MGTKSVSPYVDRVNEWLGNDPVRADPVMAATSISVGAYILGFLGGVVLLGVLAAATSATGWLEGNAAGPWIFVAGLPVAGWLGAAAATAGTAKRWHRVLGVRPATSMVLGLTADRMLVWRYRTFRPPKLELLIDIPREGISATKPQVGSSGAEGFATTLEGMAGLTLHFADGRRLTVSSSRGFTFETRRVIEELNDPGSTHGVDPTDLPRSHTPAEPVNWRRIGLLAAAIVLLAALALAMGAWDQDDTPEPPDLSQCALAPPWLVEALEEGTPPLDGVWIEPVDEETEAASDAGGDLWVAGTSLTDDGVISLATWALWVDHSTRSVNEIQSLGPMTTARSSWPPAPDELAESLGGSQQLGVVSMCAGASLIGDE